MIEKICFKCGELKPIDDFYKHPQMKDGHINKCKECTKKDVKNNILENKNYYLQYDRIRSREEARLKNMSDNRDKKIEEDPEKYREMIRKSNKKYNDNNPEKRKAHLIVEHAIKKGILIKQPCEICGNLKAHAYHDDYSKPLEVRWLCIKHHREFHRKIDL
jgi:hypothetical protein